MNQITSNARESSIRHETLRIAGEHVDREERIDVVNPWNNQVVGTVPRARP